MAQECLLLLFVVFYFPILLSAADGEENCPKFPCGQHGVLHFPFTNTGDRPECGLYIKGCDDGAPQVKMENEEWYNITRISHMEKLISVKDPKLEQLLSWQDCTALDDHNHLPPLVPKISPLISVWTPGMPSLKLFRCNQLPPDAESFQPLNCTRPPPVYGLPPSYFFVTPGKEDQFNKSCTSVQLPVGSNLIPNANLIPNSNPNDILHFLTDEITFTFTVTLSPVCYKCYERGGLCQSAGEKFECVLASATEERRSKKATIIGLVIGCPVGLGLLILLFYKRRCTTSKFRYQSRNIYADRSLNPEPESSTVFFGIPVFSCKELEEATNNFDSARELGDGGFGTVYYGILRDGREVAVKRLYEHNYRRVEQFLNEIAILTRLRHRNLVSFYGCTSRNSRELLLVYEYIPNGTVACHLHGDLAKPGMMPWPLRMKIAIEIASALAYLHASDIIHRDVKTNNILLDNSFCVKVADFGLSRLFPNNVTHASTAPQGTPGYVDPEYCQCYQLTNKSDVYSFGVVLIELISSLPAVDIDRQRDEINLATLAIKKIENREVSDLVDPSLGFGTNKKVKRTIESVAELALQCLRLAKEYRPSMDEVLEELKRIESGKDKDAPNYFEESDVHVDGISIHVDGVSNRYVRPPKLQ